MAKGSKKAGERFQAPARTYDGKFATHRPVSRAPIRQTKAQSDAALLKEMGMAPKPAAKKAKPQVPAKAAGAVASSPSTTSLADAVAKLRSALQR
jgi:hypothetical protein